MRRNAPTSGRLRAATAVLSLVALSTPATLFAHASLPSDASPANQAQAEINRNFDIRIDLAAERAGKIGLTAAQQFEIARLSADVKGFEISYDEVSALPKMVSALHPGERLAKAGDSNPVAAAREFLLDHRDLYRLDAGEIAEAGVVYVSEPKDPEIGARIVRLSQSVGRVPVFGAEMAFVMDRQNRVVSTSGTFYPDLASVDTKGALSMREALAAAAGDLGGRSFDAADFAAGPVDQGGKTRFTYTPDRANRDNPVFGEALRVEQVLFPIATGEAIPGYYVEVEILGEPSGSGPYYSYVISGQDGRVLFRNSLKHDESFNYRMFADTTGNFRPFDGPDGVAGSPHPTGLDDNFQAAFATENEILVESLLGATDPWLPATATTTNGNNVDAYMDVQSPDGFSGSDVRASTNGTVESPRQFLYTFVHDAASNDATKRQAKAVHLFYFNNYLHDIWYQRGFDEVSRNAQTDNYGRGGAGNDNLKAEGEDFSGTNNANMSTPADGSRPRMQMYRFTGPPSPNPDRDSASDFGIVAHEWSHYHSNRSIGNANGLTNNQGRSMGEGWGDWTGIIVFIRDGDNIDGVYTTGAWSTWHLWTNFTNNYYFGIRRYPYTTDLNKSPLHFRDIGPGQVLPSGIPRNTNVNTTPSEVHNAGEIWCAMLWECTVNLMKVYGVEDGRTRSMQYVADGMKNTPNAPTFNQARDAIINAANASTPADVPLLWQGFAKRGIGEGAISPASSSGNHSGITESFVAPAALPDGTVGLFMTATFHNRNVHFGGQADQAVLYGSSAWTPFAGNWDGGTTPGDVNADTPGLYDPATGVFYLRTTNTPGPANLQFVYGPGGNAGWLPIVGDWNADGIDTVGLYNPSNGVFYLRNSNTSGPADLQFVYGPGGNAGWLPIVGDWNADGTDTIGLYNPANGVFYLRDTNNAGPADLQIQYGPVTPGLQPLAGDWNSDASDTIGLYNPSSAMFFLRDSNTAGPADHQFGYGPTSSTFKAYAGNLDGQ